MRFPALRYPGLVYGLSLFICCVINTVSAHVSYIKINNNSAEVGNYNEDYERTILDTFYLGKFTKDFEFSQGDKDERILYYIHSFYGNFTLYHRNVVNKLKQINNYDRIVCIEWNAGKLRYKNAWQEAFKLGRRAGSLMNTLLEENENDFLCHSMGNRVFEGMSEVLNENVKIEKIILAAPDLDITAFQEGETLKEFNFSKVIFMVNEKDRLLQSSKLVLGRSRLGLDGINQNAFQQFPYIEKIIPWNITEEASENLLRSGHLYFIRNKTIFNKIKRELET